MLHTSVAIMVVFELVLLGSLVPASLAQLKLDRRFDTCYGRIGIIGCGIMLLILFEGHMEMLLKWGML